MMSEKMKNAVPFEFPKTRYWYETRVRNAQTCITGYEQMLEQEKACLNPNPMVIQTVSLILESCRQELADLQATESEYGPD